MKNLKETKGITLIALVITIIVMLILVAVTITVAVNGGLFDYAGKAAVDTNTRIEEEQDWTNIATGQDYEQLIAKYTTNKAEDLTKLRKAYIERNEEIMQEIEENIQELARAEGWSCIKYNNNVYKLTFIEENKEITYTTYTKVELLTTKLNIIEGSSSFGINENTTEDIRKSYPSEVFEDFTITCEDTSVITIDGYNIIAGNVDEDTDITIVLTGKASENIKNVSVHVWNELTEIPFNPTPGGLIPGGGGSGKTP